MLHYQWSFNLNVWQFSSAHKFQFPILKKPASDSAYVSFCFAKTFCEKFWKSFNYIPVTFAAKSPAHFPQLIWTNIEELRQELFSQINIETWSDVHSFFINHNCVDFEFKRLAFHSNQRVEQQQIPPRIPAEQLANFSFHVRICVLNFYVSFCFYWKIITF